MVASQLPAKLVGEFIGTFFLVFTVGCNIVAKNAVWGGVAVASVLTIFIYALGGISGGNFNPAVSLALGVTKACGGPGMDWASTFSYMLVQVSAGVAASGAYCLLHGSSFDLQYADGYQWYHAACCELLYSFMLCFVVLNVAVATRTGNAPNQGAGVAVGAVVLAGAYGAGAVSGGAFNPAIAIGVDASSWTEAFGLCFLYAAFELLGAVLAALMFKIVRPEEFGEESKSFLPEAVSEFLGTYFLVLTVGLNVLAVSKAAAYSIGAALTAMIYALGDVSGAHFNPAVTVAVFQADPVPAGQRAPFVQYWLAQLAGGVAAGFTYSWIHHGAAFAVQPSAKFGLFQAAVAEIMFTSLLCYVVLCVAVSRTTKTADACGLAIGSCIVVGGNAIGHISGGFLNPAVALGAAVVSLMHGGPIIYALEYTVFQCIGAVVAVGAYRLTHGQSEDGSERRGKRSQARDSDIGAKDQ